MQGKHRDHSRDYTVPCTARLITLLWGEGGNEREERRERGEGVGVKGERRGGRKVYKLCIKRVCVSIV